MWNKRNTEKSRQLIEILKAKRAIFREKLAELKSKIDEIERNNKGGKS